MALPWCRPGRGGQHETAVHSASVSDEPALTVTRERKVVSLHLLVRAWATRATPLSGLRPGLARPWRPLTPSSRDSSLEIRGVGAEPAEGSRLGAALPGREAPARPPCGEHSGEGRRGSGNTGALPGCSPQGHTLRWKMNRCFPNQSMAVSAWRVVACLEGPAPHEPLFAYTTLSHSASTESDPSGQRGTGPCCSHHPGPKATSPQIRARLPFPIGTTWGASQAGGRTPPHLCFLSEFIPACHQAQIGGLVGVVQTQQGLHSPAPGGHRLCRCSRKGRRGVWTLGGPSPPPTQQP